MYRPFVQAIKKHVEIGFGIAVDVAGFNSIAPKFQKSLGGDPHFLAFRSVVRDIVKYSQSAPDPSVSIICDDDPEKACGCYKMFDRLRQDSKHPENRQVLKSIAFADDEFYPQLQAADLFSWVARAESLYRWHNQDFRLRELYQEFVIASTDFKLTFTSAFWSAEHLQNLNKMTLEDLQKLKGE